MRFGAIRDGLPSHCDGGGAPRYADWLLQFPKSFHWRSKPAGGLARIDVRVRPCLWPAVGGIAQAAIVELERPAQLRQGLGIVREENTVIIDIELQRPAVSPESGWQEIKIGQ